MAQLYFHYSNADGMFMDDRGAVVSGLLEAHQHAALVVRSLVTAPSDEDWRGWILHVSDDFGEEIFDLPFASMLGKPH